MPSSTRVLVQHRQRARQSQANGASVRIRRIAEARRAGAERLGQGLQLHVDFKTDDRLVARHHFRRNLRSFRSSAIHSMTRFIALSLHSLDSLCCRALLFYHGVAVLFRFITVLL